MAVTKPQLVGSMLCLMFLAAVLLSLTSTSGGTTEDFEEGKKATDETPYRVAATPAPLAGPGMRWDVERWDGVEQLPIRPENPMYVSREASWPHRARLREEALALKKWGNSAAEEELYDVFFPLVGGNGLIEVLDFVLSNDESGFAAHSAHKLGEYLFDKSGGKWEDLGEIVSRNLLKKAPLHGALWKMVLMHGPGSADELHAYASALCWYQDEPGMLPVWISCVHGVGHGLSMLYGEDLQSSIASCAESDLGDFQYSCATGIYMDQPKHHGWAPCDVSRFPAACFRFKNHELGQLLDANVARPCDQFESRYHKIGCIWAFGFLTDKNIAMERCRKSFHRDKSAEYSDWQLDQYMACLSGAWESNRLSKLDPDESKRLCSTFKERSVHDFCMAHRVVVEGEDEARWDSSLLEKYYDPFAIPEEIKFPFPSL